MPHRTIITSFPGTAVETYRKAHGKLPSECLHCNATGKEMRPYGPRGANVCFECAMKPENRATTDAAFESQAHAAGKVSMIGTEAGPVPFMATPEKLS